MALRRASTIRALNEHRRVRFESFSMQQLPEDRCRATVSLAWEAGKPAVATAEGEDSLPGRLRCAAEATAKCLQAASVGRIELEVLAVKSIEGFDTIIVVVSLASVVNQIRERLSGSCLIKGDPARGAVLAVLTATNRLFGKMMVA